MSIHDTLDALDALRVKATHDHLYKARADYKDACARSYPLLAETLRRLAEENWRLKAGIESACSEPWPAHYGHHDPMGTGGANCPACHRQQEIKDALRALAAAGEKGAGK